MTGTASPRLFWQRPEPLTQAVPVMSYLCGNGHMTRRCRKCKRTLPIGQFDQKADRLTRYTHCQQCRATLEAQVVANQLTKPSHGLNRKRLRFAQDKAYAEQSSFFKPTVIIKPVSAGTPAIEANNASQSVPTAQSVGTNSAASDGVVPW